MPRAKSSKRNSSRSSAPTELMEEEAGIVGSGADTKRVASVYDAVAGRIGLNGFLTQEQLVSHNLFPSLPEEVLLRRVNAPDQIPYNFYNADENLNADQKLPDSDLLKAIHSYTSDFLTATSTERDLKDFRSFNETALLALGILLEEAAREGLGETGDMALTEIEGLENGRPETEVTKHQTIGRVKPRQVQPKEVPPEETDNSEQEESPRKKRRRRRRSSS